MKRIQLTRTKITLLVALLFVIAHTLVLGVMYPHTLRLMEMNCWVDDYVYQFFRWPWLGALIMAVAMVIPMLLIALVLRLVRLPRLMPLGVVASLALAYLYPPTASYEWGLDTLFNEDSRSAEMVYSYERLADQHQWEELKKAVFRDGKSRSQLGIRYALLAESGLGTLSDNLFTYPISSTEQFLYRGNRSPGTCAFNRMFYDNLGVYDECYHQAQEYSMCLPKFCLQSVCQMIDYSIRESEWKVADKLLTVLDQALFYHDFVKDRRAQVEAGRSKVADNPAPLRANNFVTGYSMKSEMYHDFAQGIGDTNKVQEYTVLCLLIRKELSTFCQALPSFPRYNCPIEQLPEAFQQALQIYQSQGEALRDALPGTYAYYFYNVSIPEAEERPLDSAPTN